MKNNQELTHHGVLGMKWGVRKNRSKDTASKPKQPRKLDRIAELEAQVNKYERRRRRGKTAAKVALGVIGGAVAAKVAVDVGRSLVNLYLVGEFANAVSKTFDEIADWV